MKATELRIGNWVKAPEGALYNGAEMQWTVFEFWRLGEFALDFKDFDPIPLTEEWLERFGFKKKEEDHRFPGTYWESPSVGDEDYLKRLIYFKGEITFEDDYYDDVTLHYNLEHVHQLQNLYFALTGEELTPTT